MVKRLKNGKRFTVKGERFDTKEAFAQMNKCLFYFYRLPKNYATAKVETAFASKLDSPIR